VPMTLSTITLVSRQSGDGSKDGLASVYTLAVFYRCSPRSGAKRPHRVAPFGFLTQAGFFVILNATFAMQHSVEKRKFRLRQSLRKY
jgi:hypothetical protein